MKTAFYDVALDQIRYSVVWEGYQNLYTALDVGPKDQVLVITSAGCNVLNTLLTPARTVTAVDVNPVQNRLLELKTQVIRQHPYAMYRGVLGLDGPDAVRQAVDRVLPSLSPTDRSFWAAFFVEHPAGILTSGRLESYLHSFYDTLPTEFQSALIALTKCPTLAAQAAFFDATLDVPAFSRQFVEYFNNRNLSRGRDSKLYAYAPPCGGELFYQRLKTFVHRHPVKHNFPFLFLFFGRYRLTNEALPPCYREEHYGALRASLDRLKIVTTEAVSYLLSEEGAAVTKAGLSNIFEYTGRGDFARSIRTLAARKGEGLRLVFWNLLNEQGNEEDFNRWREDALSESLRKQESCFYFGSVKVFWLPKSPREGWSEAFRTANENGEFEDIPDTLDDDTFDEY